MTSEAHDHLGTEVDAVVVARSGAGRVDDPEPVATDFDAAKTDIVGISADPRRAQEAFRDKHDLAMPLLSDENHDALEAFGVWGEKSMYGRTFLGIIRTTVVVGPDSRIRKVWRNVKVDGHADEVLAYVRPA